MWLVYELVLHYLRTMRSQTQTTMLQVAKAGSLFLSGLGLIIVLYACSSAPTSQHQPQVASPPQFSGPAKPWGIYQILWRTQQFTAELDNNLKLLGGKPSYVLFFATCIRAENFPAPW